MKRLLNILILIIVAVSCVKIDPFTETDDGGNVLGFYLDGNEISYITSGGLFTGKPLEHCVYARQFSANPDSLEISAKLNADYYYDISIKLAIADISTEHSITDPDITLSYLYKILPLPPSSSSEGGTWPIIAYTDFESGEISFRKWNCEAGILSGNFNFDCIAPQYDGSLKHISVTKGNFDVKINK